MHLIRIGGVVPEHGAFALLQQANTATGVLVHDPWYVMYVPKAGCLFCAGAAKQCD